MPKPIRKAVLTPTDGAVLFIGEITMDGTEGPELDVSVDEREAKFHFQAGITDAFPVAEYYAGGLSLQCDSSGLGSKTVIDLNVAGVLPATRVDGKQSAKFPLTIGDLCKDNPDGPKSVRIEGVVRTGHFYTALMDSAGCQKPDATEPEGVATWHLGLEITGSKCQRGPACDAVNPEKARVEIQVSD